MRLGWTTGKYSTTYRAVKTVRINLNFLFFSHSKSTFPPSYSFFAVKNSMISS